MQEGLLSNLKNKHNTMKRECAPLRNLFLQSECTKWRDSLLALSLHGGSDHFMDTSTLLPCLGCDSGLQINYIIWRSRKKAYKNFLFIWKLKNPHPIWLSFFHFSCSRVLFQSYWEMVWSKSCSPSGCCS